MTRRASDLENAPGAGRSTQLPDTPEPERDSTETRAPVREGEHVAPDFLADSFHCPLCGVLTSQVWEQLYEHGETPIKHRSPSDYFICICSNCEGKTCWKIINSEEWTGRMVDPAGSLGPRPHLEMPDEVKADYEEARSIAAKSPRGACALERVAVQKLVDNLEGGSADLNTKIGSMVAKGLPEEVQQTLDILRVVGNNAVHPGELDLRDDVETAVALMDCMNLIVEDRVARPSRVKKLYEKLPQGARKAIAQRDKG